MPSEIQNLTQSVHFLNQFCNGLMFDLYKGLPHLYTVCNPNSTINLVKISDTPNLQTTFAESTLLVKSCSLSVELVFSCWNGMSMASRCRCLRKLPLGPVTLLSKPLLQEGLSSQMALSRLVLSMRCLLPGGSTSRSQLRSSTLSPSGMSNRVSSSALFEQSASSQIFRTSSSCWMMECSFQAINMERFVVGLSHFMQ